MSLIKIIIAYIVAFGILAVVALLPSKTMTATRSKWYECIKPSITPPSIVFPIAWSILYTLIAISLANAFLLPASSAKTMLLLGFAVNLTLNVAWSFLYFGKRNIKGALVVIVLLWLSILWIVVMSYKLHERKWKAHILVPYLLWVTFATVLNTMSLMKEKECENVE